MLNRRSFAVFLQLRGSLLFEFSIAQPPRAELHRGRAGQSGQAQAAGRADAAAAAATCRPLCAGLADHRARRAADEKLEDSHRARIKRTGS